MDYAHGSGDWQTAPRRDQPPQRKQGFREEDLAATQTTIKQAAVTDIGRRICHRENAVREGTGKSVMRSDTQQRHTGRLNLQCRRPAPARER